MAQPEPTLEYPNTYNVTVDVRYEFEVEADNEAMAEEIAHYYEDYAMWADIESIDVDILAEYCQVCGEDTDKEHCQDEESN